MTAIKRVVAFQHSTCISDFVRFVLEDRPAELLTADSLEALAELAAESPIDLVMHYIDYDQTEQRKPGEALEEWAERLALPIRQAAGHRAVILLVDRLQFSGRACELESLGVVLADPSTSLDVSEAAVQRLMDKAEARPRR